MQEDQELVADILKGRQAAMAELIRRYEAPLSRYVRRMCFPCTPYTEDILQESFLKCYRNLNDYDSGLRFSSWLYRITHNCVVDHIRSRRIQNAMTTPMEDEDLFTGKLLHPESETRKREFQKAVQEALALLPEKQRAALVLRFWEDKDYGEIGDILKENTNTIATWLRRAREVFRKAMEDKGLELHWEEEHGSR